MSYQIELENIQKYYGAYHALRDVCLQIPKGQFVALVGPSGCGKSTLLRTIAGLEKITSGTMRIAGDAVNDKAPRERDLAMVFQSYALYPHMTVRQNLTYSMRLRRRPKSEIDKAVEEIARVTGLGELLDRYPRQLSGGQRQRVAMGRAIIRNPKAFLFDEPLSNLDAALRVHMRSEIRQLHNRLGATSVYVTHDQIEAMTMADQVVVMRSGVIEQKGAPLDLYDRPVNKFVAGFIGSPAMNFVDGVVAEGGKSVGLALPGTPEIAFEGLQLPGQKVTVGLRPEHLMVGQGDTGNEMTLPVSLVERTGAVSYVLTDTDPGLLITAPVRVEDGVRSVSVSIKPEHIHLFDRETGNALLHA
ncbi:MULTISPECIES: ABC transporter ATP-binding protein [Stappiaceae]|jgi:multiple sugar transport system ATP-binding protein|uniref:Trehalose import ATP-binding protein SugC n=1 Tax=Roseibium aggregatum TaxID=187304 RepID=A0A0M6Y9A9_9HYPH|nr:MULTISPECIES: sn-glycerol-3-phosphate ABC transporter ATP-binding protein UgpC [Stappiaceae]MBO9462222.1 sn-glycerol-3-phosphate ABC transporter ATP-binding protein UgpC [Labrenzia sp. R5_0]CTQ46686.1 Trehalose import ATP-binding protein SugC [Roseibium aggregatum]